MEEMASEHKEKLPSVICPYCGSRAVLTSNISVYGRTYGNGRVWICENFPACDSYVGAHADGTPLGRLANPELRSWKKAAHRAFDPLWKSSRMTRNEAYRWLQKTMGLTKEEGHIGKFDVDQCRRLIELIDAEELTTTLTTQTKVDP